jgi:hypothetical protein
MAEYTEHTGRAKKVVLEPQIMRAFWSKRRAWQNEEVKLFIETRYVKDGTPLKIEIFEEADRPQLVTEVKGDHKVSGGKCEATYKIKWDPPTLGKDLTPQGDEWDFYFLVTIEKPALSKKSGLLYVDLDQLMPSV